MKRSALKSVFVLRATWLTTVVLTGLVNVGDAEEKTPTPTPTPTPVAAASSQPMPVDTAVVKGLIDDALAGRNAALASLRVSAPTLDDQTAMALLERVRSSGASRHSAIATCFVGHREAWVQRTAIETIAKLGVDSPETVAVLVKAVQDPSPLVAQAAATALGDLRDARSWAPLIDLLSASNTNLSRLAHESLQRQTLQRLPPDHAAWSEWLSKRKTDEEALFARFQTMLVDPAGDPVAAVDGLAGLLLLRDQASAVLVTLIDHPNATVRANVERHLRQWTGTLGREGLAIAVDRAQATAIAPPPAMAPDPTTIAPAAPVAKVATVADPAFFESTYGIVLIVTLISATLAVLLWFLRTPVGKAVQNATMSFTKRVGRSRVVVMISNGTKRIVRNLPKPLREVTKRFASPAKNLAGKLADETHRMLNPHKPK